MLFRLFTRPEYHSHTGVLERTTYEGGKGVNASAREKKRTHATGGHPSVTNTMPVTRTGHHPNPTATGPLPPRPYRTVPRGCLPTSYQPAQGARPWVKVLKTPFQFRPDAFDRESHQLVENLRCSLQYSRARLIVLQNSGRRVPNWSAVSPSERFTSSYSFATSTRSIKSRERRNSHP